MTLEQTLHREGHAVTPMNVQLAMAISTLSCYGWTINIQIYCFVHIYKHIFAGLVGRASIRAYNNVHICMVVGIG